VKGLPAHIDTRYRRFNKEYYAWEYLLTAKQVLRGTSRRRDISWHAFAGSCQGSALFHWGMP